VEAAPQRTRHDDAANLPRMLRFFPFGEHFEPGMAGRSLSEGEPLIDVDEPCYASETALKRQLLATAPHDYFLAPPELDSAQWEVLELVCTDLARRYPDWFVLERSGDAWRWENRLLAETAAFGYGDTSTLPLAPLDWLGRQVQEDLVLVRADAAGTLIGGQLCFPNGWDLPDRAGKAYLAIHERTPASTLVGVHAGGRLLQALKPNRTFCRIGWNFKLSRQLDLSTKHLPAYLAHAAERAPQLDADGVGRELFIRIERQTFTRLTRSPHVLFGIHTYLSALEVEAQDPERARRILQVVKEAPDDVKRYKAILPLEAAFTHYLEGKAMRAPSQHVGSAVTTNSSGYHSGPNSGPRPSVASIPASANTEPMLPSTSACLSDLDGAKRAVT
jgi:dimethylamine monooxygenase subunit A